jgi:hypothetical protein
VAFVAGVFVVDEVLVGFDPPRVFHVPVVDGVLDAVDVLA